MRRIITTLHYINNNDKTCPTSFKASATLTWQQSTLRITTLLRSPAQGEAINEKIVKQKLRR
jgi:hypothetical protein